MEEKEEPFWCYVRFGIFLLSVWRQHVRYENNCLVYFFCHCNRHRSVFLLHTTESVFSKKWVGKVKHVRLWGDLRGKQISLFRKQQSTCSEHSWGKSRSGFGYRTSWEHTTLKFCFSERRELIETNHCFPFHSFHFQLIFSFIYIYTQYILHGCLNNIPWS